MQNVITHRGLEPSNPFFFPESSLEAFQDHLERGFGIEFDPNFASDGIVVSHDSSLNRILDGDMRLVSEVSVAEIQEIHFGSRASKIPLLSEVLNLISSHPSAMCAMHLKGKFQEAKYIDQIIELLIHYPKTMKNLFIFDVKPETARYIKKRSTSIKLAPSVSHNYDIERFNKVVFGTLMTISQAINNREFYDWAWLDEWDRCDKGGSTKTFYNPETFRIFREAGYKIGLVTPELHGTSPGLLGGEAHEDSINKIRLFERIEEIVYLQPDAICTDYPEEVRYLSPKI